MGMPLDDILDLAIDRRQRAVQQRHAGRARDPFGAGKTLGALQPALAGKPLGDIDLVGGQDVDAEEAIALQQRPGRRFAVDADDQGRPARPTATTPTSPSCPRCPCRVPAVMTLTPPVSWRMAPRKSLGGHFAFDRHGRGQRNSWAPHRSDVSSVALQQVLQDRAFQRREFGRTALPRTRNIDSRCRARCGRPR